MIQELSLDLFGEMLTAFTPKPSAEEIRLANALVADGEQNTVEGREQQKYAEMARALIVTAENEARRTELARIAVWHYEKSGTGFRRSTVSFESAAKIQKNEKLRRKLLKKAETAAELAMQAELSVLEVTSDQKKRRIK
ncbi:MAG TPA: hypothetical protein VNB22_07555 [Pyrinomonadaceae bacterium]|jgi:hypothetical protein|nr:hypothetical protein [Pyrinomonadaceae bacterium]